jgi:TetR/AcrR family transcriptional regulator, repressor for uid operon
MIAGMPDGDATRQRLVAAAAEVFAERGYDGAGVQEIARRAGLTTGAIYSRYSGKAELLRDAIAENSTDELDELFNQHRFEGHVSDVIRVAGSHLVERTAQHATEPGAALLLEAFVAARRDPEIRTVVKAMLEDRAGRLAEIIEAAKADGSVDPAVDTDAAVRFCHAVGLGFLVYEALELDLPRSEPWEALITRLVVALAAAPDTDEPKGD